MLTSIPSCWRQDALEFLLRLDSQYIAQTFAIAMPNLKPPVTTTEQAIEYREKIIQHVPDGIQFEPLMTLYLTDNTNPEEIYKAKASNKVIAVKYYPAGAKTNSYAGVTHIDKVSSTLHAMAKDGLAQLLRRDGFNSVSQAIGVDVR